MITDINQLDKKGTYTYADYLTWRLKEMVELIKGKVFILSPAPAERHQRILGNVSRLVSNYLYGKPCSVYFAPFDVRLIKNSKKENEIYTVVQPDLCIICEQSKIDEKGCLGSPDWVIEILSPASSKKDLNEKYNLYEENGVQEYWVVFPDSNAVNQYVLVDGKYEYTDTFFKNQKLSPAIFPDFSIDLEEVFR